ncbi:MAG: ABC transporter permease, partial [bacterium]
MWRRSPWFTAVAATAIALGIGANAAVFTIANAFLIKNLPFEGSDRILYISGDTRTEAGFLPVSYPDYRDFRTQTKSFADLAAFEYAGVSVTDKSGFPERYRAIRMSANGLSVLGQKPAAGRDFTPEDVRPGATPVAILTYPLWEDRYGKDPSLIGKIVRVDEVPTAVIGVTPPGVILAGGNDLWLPLIPTADFEKRGTRTLLVLGRLAEHANLRSANAEMQTIARALEREYPVTNKNIGALVQNMADAHLNRRAKSLLRALLGSVGFLLLIACANVANLLLARAAARSREISIRWAVGAGRWRLIRQLMMESLLLAAAGGLIGWLLAVWGVHAFVAALTRIEKMPALDFSMDQTVLLYLVAISAGTGLLFGLAPALRLSKIDANTTLKDGGHNATAGPHGRRLSTLLVAGQIALALALLAGAGVLIRSFLNIYL